MTKSRPSDVFFLSCPRTLSNLLVKLLSQQEGWEESGYYLHMAGLYAMQNFSFSVDAEATPEKRQEFVKQLREGWTKMQEARETAHKNGNAMFLKSHIWQIWPPSMLYEGTKGGEYASELTLTDEPAAVPRTNPSMLTDEYLASFVPVFLVRHPALLVDSWYRTEARSGNPPDIKLTTREHSFGYGLARQLYDWYAKLVADSDEADLRPGSKAVPIVVDADDILEGDTVHRLAETIGMDPAQVLQSWEAKSTEGLIPLHKSYVQGIWESTGIDKSKSSKFLNVEDKYKSWHELYGDEVGDYLVKLTESYMADYEFLKSKKM